MGNCFSINSSCDPCITLCWNCIAEKSAYIRHLGDNLKDLEIARGELWAKKEDVMRRLRIEEGPQMKRLEAVETWRLNVEAMITEVDELIRDGPQETEKLCLGGCCSTNCKSSYTFGKKVAKRVKDVADLKSKGVFTQFVEWIPAGPAVERPSEPTIVGLETMLDNVWGYLMQEQVGIVGIHGMGGVGKTTLLTEIINKFPITDHDFDVVIWVVVTKDLRLEKIQEDIWKKIGVLDEQWKKKSFDEKGEDIFSVLHRKKFVLLLDDIWQRVDLVKLGVPHPKRRKGPKVVFTTRSEEVCGQMGAEKRIKVESLVWEKAWELFKETVGEETLNHPDISSVAEDVAKECGGLPLALKTVARAMVYKPLEEWKYALEVLRKSASDFQGMEDEVLPILKFSYDSLPHDKLKSCFLYCALFPEDFDILKDDLIDYWMCEEFWGDDDIRPSSRYKGYDIIGTLVRVCLLEEKGKHVKMHDVVRETALWITRKFGKDTENFLVKTGAQLTKAPKATEWHGVRRMSLMGNRIKKLEKTPACPHLLTLLLSRNRLSIVSKGFFDCMDALTVLDLSHNEIRNLPLGISKLVSLQYLNLSYTSIKELPLELKELVTLKYLNMDYTVELVMIPRQVISSLSSLKVLKMFGWGSKDATGEDNILCDDNIFVEELQWLKHLDVLTIQIRSPSAFYKLPSCTRALRLEDLGSSDSLDISPFSDLKDLDRIEFLDAHHLKELNVRSMMEGITETQVAGVLHNSAVGLGKKSFDSLQTVYLALCRGLQHLTWLSLAPNLRALRIKACDNMTEIISVGKLGEVPDMDGSRDLFAKLEVLVLWNLRRLRSICSSALPFSFLKRIKVFNCKRLKKLPLDSNSARGCQVVIKAEQSWFSNVEWEDDATKATFLPCFMPVDVSRDVHDSD